jgi:K+/H+ antiporter YhaU regulatory subunit KhtT
MLVRSRATAIAVVREGVATYEPDPSFSYRPGDVVVPVGAEAALERAERVFLAESLEPRS